MNLNRFYEFENRRNKYDFGPSEVEAEDVILVRYLMISNEGEIHERLATNLID